MFDLQAGVHFDEVELAVFPQEFDRARPAIAHVGHGLGDDAAHAVPLFRRNHGGGSFFEHFLVAALERAIALSQMNGIAFTIAEHLKFDMARIAEVFFQIHRVVTKGGLRLIHGLTDKRFQLVSTGDDFHPPATAARSRLGNDGKADFLRDPAHLVKV